MKVIGVALAALCLTISLTSRADCPMKDQAPKHLRTLFEDKRYLDLVKVIASNEANGPESVAQLLLLGQAQTKRRLYRDAHKAFAQAYKRAPNEPKVAFHLALAELHGYSGKQNLENGRALLEAAASAGCADAQYMQLVEALQKSNYQDKKAVAKLVSLSQAGHENAAVVIAQLYSKGVGVTANQSKAFKHFQTAAEQGNALAQYEIGNAFHWGNGVKKNKRKAKRWLAKARSQGNGQAHWLRGLDLISRGQLREGHHEYWHSATAGFTSGQINLAVGYLYGTGVPQNFEKALHWLQNASSAPLAMQYLGDIYFFGLGVEQDYTNAYQWYLKASRVIPSARASVALMLQTGLGVEKDETAAQELFASLSEVSEPQDLSSIAWALATNPISELRRPRLAMEYAERAYALDPSDSAAGTLAATRALLGDYAKAVALMRQILTGKVSPSNRDRLESQLSSFERDKPWFDSYPLAVHRQPEKSEVKPRATFTGEITAIFQRPKTGAPLGYDVEPGAVFGIVVLVTSVESGSLPYFMSEEAIFYIHSPTHFLGGIDQRLSFLQVPEGLFRFKLQEVQNGYWRNDLALLPIE